MWNRGTEVARGRAKKAEEKKVDQLLDKLLDITTCPHTIMLCHDPGSGCTGTEEEECKVKAYINCTRLMASKIPVIELQWLYMQVSEEPRGKCLAHFVPDEPVHPEKPALKTAEALYDVLEEFAQLIHFKSYRGTAPMAILAGKGAHLPTLKTFLEGSYTGLSVIFTPLN